MGRNVSGLSEHSQAQRSRATLRTKLKAALVEAGMRGLASRRVIRGVIIMLGLEKS